MQWTSILVWDHLARPETMLTVIIIPLLTWPRPCSTCGVDQVIRAAPSKMHPQSGWSSALWSKPSHWAHSTPCSGWEPVRAEELHDWWDLNTQLSDLQSIMLTITMLKCCLTSTETVGLLGTGAQDGHLDFHTPPELWPLQYGGAVFIRPFFLLSPSQSQQGCQWCRQGQPPHKPLLWRQHLWGKETSDRCQHCAACCACSLPHPFHHHPQHQPCGEPSIQRFTQTTSLDPTQWDSLLFHRHQ